MLCAAYLLLAIVSPGAGGLGLGDVKLAALLGLLLGWLSIPQVLYGPLAAFLLGGLLSVALLASRRATRKSYIAFGPHMLLGAALGFLLLT